MLVGSFWLHSVRSTNKANEAALRAAFKLVGLVVISLGNCLAT